MSFDRAPFLSATTSVKQRLRKRPDSLLPPRFFWEVVGMIIHRATALSVRLLPWKAAVRWTTPPPLAVLRETTGVGEGFDIVMSSPPLRQADLRGPTRHRYLVGEPSLGAPPLPPRHTMAAEWVGQVRPSLDRTASLADTRPPPRSLRRHHNSVRQDPFGPRERVNEPPLTTIRSARVEQRVGEP